MGRLSFTAKAAVLLIAAPCLWLGTWALWHYTRDWIPLRISLSGKPGIVRTEEFKINVAGDYSIDLATDAPGNDCAERPRVRWSLYKQGSPAKAGEAEPTSGFLWPQWACTIGRFHADAGVYRIELDGPNNQSLLVVYENGGQFIDSTAHGARAFTTCVILLPIGFATLLIAAIRQREQTQVDYTQKWTFTQPGSLPGPRVRLSVWRRPKQVAARTFSVAGKFNLNHSSLLIVLVLMLLWTVFALQVGYVPHGFAIRVSRPRAHLVPAVGIMPLRIRVLVRGVQIGPQIIDRTDLDAFLRREIPKRSPDWPVYVEGDPNLEYESVARTIDAVSALRATVVLLTPGYKKELGEFAPQR